MNLKDLGFNEEQNQLVIANNWLDFEIGRVVLQHKDRYVVLTENGETEAEITGNLRFSAQSKVDFPAVGDWVALMVYDEGVSIIHHVLPRKSVLKRQAAGKHGEVQLIATNIDYALLVQAVDRDFSINRLERYLTICNAGKVSPLIVLTKTDLIDAVKKQEFTDLIQKRIKGIPVIAISNLDKDGIPFLEAEIKKGKTYCLMGSSGVGKSTLLNNLSGKEDMKTGEINPGIQRGRHVTTHRELFILPGGGIIIDNPGMREVGIVDTQNGLESTFDEIMDLAKNCKYADCTHIREQGCAVIEAVEQGLLDQHAYDNYLRMLKEKAHFNMTVEEKRKKDKSFGKMLKNYKKSQ